MKKNLYKLTGVCGTALMAIGLAGPITAFAEDSQPSSATSSDTNSENTSNKSTSDSTDKTQKPDDTKTDDKNGDSTDTDTKKMNYDVQLVDAQGNSVGHVSVSGNKGDKITVGLPAGYEVLDQPGTKQVVYVVGDNTPIKVKAVDTDNSKSDTKSDSNTQFKQRIIKLHLPSGEVQTVTLNGTVSESYTEDEKGNKTVLSTSVTFPEYIVPNVDGYVPSEAKIASNDKRATVDITFRKQGTVEVDGYKVADLKTITRTINLIDENGKKVADPVVEKLTYETLIKLDKDGKETSTKATAAALIKDDKATVNSYASFSKFTAPAVKGYKLKDQQMDSIEGQAAWIAPSDAPAKKLANGLDEFLTKDTIYNIVFTKDESQATSDANAKKDSTDNNNKDNASNTTKDNNNANAAKVNGLGAGAEGGTSVSGIGGGSSVLPQTGNAKASTGIFGLGAGMSLLSLGLGFLKKKIF